MSTLTLQLPETLHHQLEMLARNESVSLDQYIVYALTRQVASAYVVHRLSADAISEQKASYAALRQSLGHAAPDEIEQALAEREGVTPEPDLTPEAIVNLQNRIAASKSSLV